jgi:hypothetical protein
VEICSAAKCVPPDKPGSRETDGHAAGAAVFAELINVRASGGGLCAAACPLRKPKRYDRQAAGPVQSLR